jgi:SAM-dependent methyltransferase
VLVLGIVHREPTGPPLDEDLVGFVMGALPAPPARILEVGAGRGELAARLRQDGHDVRAIDRSVDAPGVERVALIDVEAPAAAFDAAVAVLSLHHVAPLGESCRRLAELVRPGGVLVIDEFDVEALDERAARWWLAQRRAEGAEGEDAAGLVADLQGHLHALARVREELSPYFGFGEPWRGPYLHRWHLAPGRRGEEEDLIAAGRLPATGARLVGFRAS